MVFLRTGHVFLRTEPVFIQTGLIPKEKKRIKYRPFKFTLCLINVENIIFIPLKND